MSDARQQSEVLRALTQLGWQAQRMAMEARDAPPTRTLDVALAALDELQEAIARARARIVGVCTCTEASTR